MKKYTSKGGPAISVLCTVRFHQVEQIELSLHDREGLEWACEGDASSKDLKDLLANWFSDYSQRKPSAAIVPFNMKKLPLFTKRVLNAVLELPFGTVASYQDVAKQLHNPKASRAVGNACGRNPFPLLIPCHRIITKSHQLGGYSAGFKGIKEQLLFFETGKVF